MQSCRDNCYLYRNMKFNKRAQEEMVGFALIIIIVSIIIIAFIGFFLSKSSSQSIQSYEAQSFIQSALQTSTQCQNYYGYISVQNLIVMCSSGSQCSSLNSSNSEDSCAVLNSTLNGILGQSWPVGQGSSIKGYNLNISANNGFNLDLNKGNFTSKSEGSYQDLSESGVSIKIEFTAYS